MNPQFGILVFSVITWLPLICLGIAQTNIAPKDSRPKQTQPGDKHSTDKNNIDAIGRRKIGGQGLGNWYSFEKEISIGKSFADAIDGSTAPDDDRPTLKRRDN